jgi:multicomponent Na+:H+ antiporter subunit F
VVALDLITVQIAAMLAVDTIATGQPVFLDAAIVLALISFLGTVAFARYLERRGHDE